jgi:hypothetical protein
MNETNRNSGTNQSWLFYLWTYLLHLNDSSHSMSISFNGRSNGQASFPSRTQFIHKSLCLSLASLLYSYKVNPLSLCNLLSPLVLFENILTHFNKYDFYPNISGFLV